VSKDGCLSPRRKVRPCKCGEIKVGLRPAMLLLQFKLRVRHHNQQTASSQGSTLRFVFFNISNMTSNIRCARLPPIPYGTPRRSPSLINNPPGCACRSLTCSTLPNDEPRPESCTLTELGKPAVSIGSTTFEERRNAT
jgi:hypothetical protein